ncbi:Detected protein of confused Function [Hibiscus syriacus]|uniref:16S rRNA (uracil(1498)-N(3))-methyltransferase n=1 Tax=Hibiscus syriacus TaxID=106335 RepID=A0A6A2YUR7_HIBSY|nr:Detected protein of confused Function [Hibiscus syriacus]
MNSVLFNGRGGLVEGFIQNIERTTINFVSLEDLKLVLPHTPQWHIFSAFGSLKGGRADWLVEKCIICHYELGASSVTPLLTKRSYTISDNRVERLQRVILAALDFTYVYDIFCQRLYEMKLNHPMKINKLIPLVTKSKQSFIAIVEATPLVSALTSTSKEPNGLLLYGSTLNKPQIPSTHTVLDVSAANAHQTVAQPAYCNSNLFSGVVLANGWEPDDSTNVESYNGWGPADAPKHSELGNTGWIDELTRKDYNGWGVQDFWPTWVNNIFFN